MWLYYWAEIVKDSTAGDFKMWPLANMLMGNRINEGFYKKIYGCFARSKKVAVMTKWLYYQGGR